MLIYMVMLGNSKCIFARKLYVLWLTFYHGLPFSDYVTMHYNCQDVQCFILCLCFYHENCCCGNACNFN